MEGTTGLEEVVFFVAAAIALGGAVGVIAFRNPFYSVLSLVVNLIGLAVLFLLLEAAFVAAAQIIVYVGAVLVLYVFVAAYIGGDEEELAGGMSSGALGALFAVALLVELCFAVIGSTLVAVDHEGATVEPGFGSPGEIGALLLTRFLLVFEVASFILLAAAVGAIVLARRRRAQDELLHHPGVFERTSAGEPPASLDGQVRAMKAAAAKREAES